MDESNTIKSFTAFDIEKYHKGLLSARQMHDMEKAALEDPFLADALDGYAVSGVNATADLEELRKRLAEKTQEAKIVPLKAVSGGGQRKFPWMRAAALIIVVGGAGLLAQRMFTTKKDDSIASNNVPAAKKQETTDNARNGNIDTPLADTVTLSGTAGLKRTAENTNFFFSNTDSPKTSVADGEVATLPRTETVQPGSSTVTTQRAVTTTADTKADMARTDDVAATNKPVDYLNSKTSGTDVKSPPAPVVSADSTSTVQLQYWAAETSKKEDSRKIKAKKVAHDSDADGVKDQFDREQKKQVTAANGAGISNNRQANGYLFSNQSSTVFRGRVTDANNVGLPFARVMNPADNNAGTYTDVRGYFTLTYPDSTVNVQVRSVGFDNTNLQLRSSLTTNQVTMQEDKSLAEVVVSNKKPNADRRRDANMKLEEPEPLDGWDNYDTYIANNVEVPDELKSKPAPSASVVEVSFEVNKYGEPVNIKVERSLCSKCDAEAVRLVKEGPKWRRNANKKGRTTVTISF